MKWVKYLLALGSVIFIAQFTNTNSAYATSDYDNAVTNATQLKLSYPGYSDLDVTTNYMGYILGTITSGVAYNDCGTTCQSIINDSLDYGDHSISEVHSTYPVDNYSVESYFCDQAMTSTNFQGNSSTNQREILYSSTTLPANCVNIHLEFQPVTGGGDIFVVSNISSNVTTDVAEVAYQYFSGTDSPYSQPFVYTGAFAPPEGYEGETPQATYSTTAPTTLYTGTIDCGGEMPVAMSIYQPGNIGAATLTQQSLGIAQWSYNLTSEPYSFTVDCGDGKLATPYGAVSPAAVSNDWICDIYSTDPYHCALS